MPASKSSSCSQSITSAQGLAGSGHPLSNTLFVKDPITRQQAVVDGIHSKQQRSSHDNVKPPTKSFLGSFTGDLHAVVEHQMAGGPVSRSVMLSQHVDKGPDNFSQSFLANRDSSMKNGNSSVTHGTVQNISIICKNSHVSTFNDIKDSVRADRDAGPSNIELRLGQPCQQSQAMVNSDLSYVGSDLIDTLVEHAKPVLPEKMMFNSMLK